MWEMPTLQHTSATKVRSTKICTIPQLPLCQERCTARSIRDTHFQSRHHIDYSTSNHQPQLHAADDLDCCFMAIFSWRKPVGPRIMRRLWSNITTRQSPNLREETDDTKEKQTEDNSRERGVQSQLRAAAQRCSPEDAEDPMVARPDYEIRQSGRVLELQSRDLWLRPTDVSWHLPILMTIREEPFKNCRSRTSEKWKAKEDEIEAAKKQKIKRSDGERNFADWQPSSWSWQQPMTWTSSSSSSWQQWGSDQTRERSDLQPSADWSSSDQTRERSGWRSSGSWQSPCSWQ